MNKIRILLIDDDALMREGLKIILESDPQLQVIGEARDGHEAVALTKNLLHELEGEGMYDIALVDIRMPKLNGVETVKQLMEIYPEAVLLMLTTFDDEEYIIDALRNGTKGYLLKDMSKDRLIRALKDAVAGEFMLPSKVAVKLANASKELKKERVLLQLSEREEEVARLLAKGFTNKQIAQALYISEGTVKNYVSQIYSKIEIYDRAAAALYLQQYVNE